MKGSGSAMTAGRGSRAAFTRGMRSMGSSPEIRSEGMSSFSSRNLSMFNRNSISRPPSSIINKDAVKRGMSSGKPMIDISRPFAQRDTPRGNVLRAGRGKSIFSETKPQIRSRLDKLFGPSQKLSWNYKADKALRINPFEKSVVLWKNPNIGVEKKTQSRPSAFLQKDHIQRIKPVSFEKRFAKKSPFESVMREGKIYSSARKHENTFHPKTEPIKLNQKRAHELRVNRNLTRRAEVRKIVMVLPKRKFSPEVHIQRAISFNEIFRTTPKATQAAVVELQRDIIRAEQMIPLVMMVKGVAQSEARAYALQALVEKTKTNPNVEVLQEVKAKFATQTKTDLQAVAQRQRTDVQVKEKTKQAEKIKTNEKPQFKNKVLFFGKDEKTNNERVKLATKVSEKLFFWKKRGFVTGKEIAGMLSSQKDKNTSVSEIAKVVSKDGTFNEFAGEVAKMDKVSDLSSVETWARAAVKKATAVKLTFAKKSGVTASEEDAMRVYQGPLNGVTAYVAEDGSVGKLYADKQTNKVMYVTDIPRTQKTDLAA